MKRIDEFSCMYKNDIMYSTVHVQVNIQTRLGKKKTAFSLQMYTRLHASGSIYVNSCTQYLHVYNISGANPCKRVHPSAGNAFTLKTKRGLHVSGF